MQKVKNIIKLLLPPLFLKVYRIFMKNKQLPFKTHEGIYEHLEDVQNATDYDSPESLHNTYIETIRKFEDSQDERLLPKSEIMSQINNFLPMIVAIFRVYIGKRKEITILDYGGGMGTSYIDCLNSINCVNIRYYVVDLPGQIELGRKIFPQEYNIHFLENISGLKKVDLVYLGSVLQYILDYKPLLLELINKDPFLIFLTNHRMGNVKTYATAQVNMPGRRIAAWVIQLQEILSLFETNGYSLIYKSVNYQPFHRFDNIPEYYRVDDTCNLLFSKVAE